MRIESLFHLFQVSKRGGVVCQQHLRIIVEYEIDNFHNYTNSVQELNKI